LNLNGSGLFCFLKGFRIVLPENPNKTTLNAQPAQNSSLSGVDAIFEAANPKTSSTPQCSTDLKKTIDQY
jgi:hypothetical protein